MNKKIIFAFILLSAICVMGTVIFTADNAKQKNISDSEITSVGYKYTIKVFNGNVAVFNFGSTYPIEVLECPLNSLPDDEAKMLKAGINIETEEELQQLIEAYD